MNSVILDVSKSSLTIETVNIETIKHFLLTSLVMEEHTEVAE